MHILRRFNGQTNPSAGYGGKKLLTSESLMLPTVLEYYEQTLIQVETKTILLILLSYYDSTPWDNLLRVKLIFNPVFQSEVAQQLH